MLAPGSVPWLLANELRLAWRAPKSQGRRRAVGLIIGGAALVLVGVPMGTGLARRDLPVSAPVIAGVDAALLIVFTVMLNLAASAASLVFFDRGDLDLLLSSPLSGRKVLTVRAAVIAGAAFSLPAAMVTPFLLPVAVLGRWPWLGAYAALAALALLAASAGIGLAMTLFRLIGPRAAKTVGQILASAIGAGAFVASQSARFIPGLDRAVIEGVTSGTAAGVLSPWSPLSWPARAALGQPGPLAGLVLVSLAVFALTAHRLGERFVVNAALGAGVAAPRTRAPRDERMGGFGAPPFWVLVRKEWRLILRDPALVSQILTRVLYLLPLGFLVIGGGLRGGPAAAAVAGPLTLAVGQIAGSLAWISLSAEDAPDLIAASPLAGAFTRRAKLAAALQPVAVLALVPLVAMAMVSARLALVTAAGAAASAISAGLINLWMEKPARRQTLGRRRAAFATVVAELGVGLGWALASALGAAGSPWAAVPVLFSLLGLGAIKVLAEPDKAY